MLQVVESVVHELSIAEAVVGIVRRHAPAGAVVRGVKVRAGPMRGVEPEALAWAWQAATDGTELAGSAIEVEVRPWALHCPACGRDFTSADLFAACACGYDRPNPSGAGDELQVVSLTVDE